MILVFGYEYIRFVLIDLLFKVMYVFLYVFCKIIVIFGMVVLEYVYKILVL